MSDIQVFISLRFWISFALAAGLCGLSLLPRFRPHRSSLFVVVQALFLVGGLGLPALTVAILAAALALVYFSFKSKKFIWSGVIAVLILMFSREWLFRPLSASPQFILFLAVGFSYTCLRLSSYLMDLASEKIENPNLLDFLAYALFVPAFVSGPIDRTNRFVADLHQPVDLSLESTTVAVRRIAIGLVKKLLVVPWLAKYAIAPQIILPAGSTPWFSLYAYAALIFMDFSGYSDLAVGSARFFGIQLPENFNKPYLKTNLIDFWNSWHMSLTSWLRDYVFLPVGQLGFRWQALAHPLIIGTVCYIITMVFCGLWHSVAPHFFVWGLYHGLGLAVCKAFRFWTGRHAPEKFRAFQSSKPGLVLNSLLTFHFVMLGWIFFVLNLRESKILIRNLIP